MYFKITSVLLLYKSTNVTYDVMENNKPNHKLYIYESAGVSNITIETKHSQNGCG